MARGEDGGSTVSPSGITSCMLYMYTHRLICIAYNFR